MSLVYTPPAFVPVKYIPASQKDAIRDRPVAHIKAAAHEKTPGPYEGGVTNHWCLYLQTGEQEAVQIDVQPNPQQPATVVQGGSKADVIVSLLQCTTPQNVVHHSKMTVPAGLVVAHVVDYIMQHGRHRYEFTAAGVGCRRWVSDTLSLLQDKEWLDKTAVETTKDDILKLWPEQIALEIDNGEYYHAS